MHRNAEAMTRNQYKKYLEYYDCKSKILSSTMYFYVTGFNTRLKAGHDEPNKPLSALHVAECDLNGEDMQYGLDNLPIEKPPKTLASSSKDPLKAPAFSSKGSPKEVSDLAS